MNNTLSQWPLETVVAFIGIAFLLAALVFKKLFIANWVITGQSLFYVWLIFLLLAVLVRLFRSAAKEIKTLVRARRQALAGLSALMYLTGTAVLIWVQFWLAKLALTAR